MTELNETGEYNIGETYLSAIKEVFPSGWVDDAQTAATIGRVHEDYGYALDPHTAVAWQVAESYRRQSGDTTPNIIVSTASPFKFNETVLAALTEADCLKAQTEFTALSQLAEMIDRPIPPALAELEHKPVRHTAVCSKQDMPKIVKATLHITE